MLKVVQQRVAVIVLNKNMAEEIELQKLKEEYPEFFRKTPPEVIDFALSKKTSEKIANIVTKNGIINAGKVEEVAERVTWVLLGKLPSGNLALTLELWVKLTPETAKKIADEANQFISSAIAQLKSGEAIQPKKEISKEEILGEGPKKPPSKDTYREQI